MPKQPKIFLNTINPKVMKIAIGAAAGNVGSRTARRLSAAGIETILIGRHGSHLSALNLPNAQIRLADLGDAQQVVKATQGAEALLWLVPPTLAVPSLKGWYEAVTAAGVAAVRANRIRRVVLVSSLGVGMADHLGTITYAANMEQAFYETGSHVVALRPGYFMENFLLQRHDILQNGFFAFPYEEDHDIPFVSTDDIGDAAAAYLADPTWAGQWTRNLMGPRNLTLPEAAQRISTVLGRPVQYRKVAYEAVREQFAALGASATVQKELDDLYRALGDPHGAYATPRTPEANTPTFLEQVIRTKLLGSSQSEN
jgi:uncharacterized protein YbjT (DUF2867 family)